MERLYAKYQQKMAHVSTKFIRDAYHEIDWSGRLIGLRGARGVGKTTLLLQHSKLNLPQDERTLYVSLDNIWFSENKLVDFVDQFVQRGGQYLLLDEVHKYPNWAQELKNSYDDYPTLQIIFTSSSLLEILNARADLSRRADMYTLQGLSFREYLNFELEKNLSRYSLEEIIHNHFAIAGDITKELKPLQYFDAYLKSGYYPFYKENRLLYHQKIEEVTNLILEIELPLLRNMEIAYVQKVKQLLRIIISSVPFKPNVAKLSERIGINRNTLVTYLHYLEEAKLTKHLYKDAKGITLLQKPDKIYLENTNMLHAFGYNSINQGNERETFFANQVGLKHVLEYSDKGDFLVNHRYIFEIAGKNKNGNQIEGIDKAYIVADDIELGLGNKIPLWLFGFLY
jgi:uncharacterized protein